MSVTPPIGFNFGSDAATSPDVTFTTAAYATPPDYGWSVTGNISSVLRTTTVDNRLRGIVHQVNNGTKANFRVDLPNGTYDMRVALGDYQGSHTDMLARFFDGASTTALVTVSGSTSAAQRWLDATGVELNATTWPTDNATASITITNSYLRMELGNSTGDYSVISHLSFAEAAASGQPFAKRFGGVPGAALNRGVW